ncbi:DNA polymerase zeta catalytic subunit-like protein [Tanacetum coccineum]
MDQTILKSHVEKPKKFKGSDFRRWQQKMLFYLKSLHVSYVLTDCEPIDPYLVDGQNVPTEAQMTDYERAASQWNHNEYNCRNYILNALDDSLYDIYSTFEIAREIWESLEKKYRTQVACSKKFVVGKFLNFKMNDAKPVVKQVEELQIIVYEIEVEGMGINFNFLVGSIIEKFPQSWKNFKLYLKHLTDDMSFEQLVLKIRVEEDNRMIEKADANLIEPNANLVGESSFKSKSNHKNKGKNSDGSGQKYSKDGKKDYTQQKNNNFKKVYHCWVCGKPGHKGCTKHICNSRRMFVSYQKVNELEPMFMGNGTSSKIEGKGKVILKLTSRKDLVLSNVLHVPNITTNLISGPILSNKGFKLVIESDKLVITKGGVAAMESSEAPYWKEAIQSEIDSIVHNNTWKLVDLPSGHKPIGHKWIFKKKLRPDGTIEKYKARLVAKGYHQKEGQDFFDTYSPVTRITSIDSN